MEKRNIRDRLEKSMALLSSLNTPIHKAKSIDKPTNETGKPGDAKGESPGTKSPATSRPYDYDAYMARVRTFTSLQWMAKPVWLSPMECARYGWENTDVDILHCVSCDSHISGRIPDSFQIDVYSECVSRIAASLHSGHREVCPWFSSCCPEYFMEVPLQDTATASTLFTKLVGQLSQLGEALPLITRSQAQIMGFVDKHLEQLFRLADCQDNGEESSEALSAVILATCGWNAGSHSKADLISCTLCNRNVGLWNFTNSSKEKGDHCTNGHSMFNSSIEVCASELTPGGETSKQMCRSPEEGGSQVVPSAEGYDSSHGNDIEAIEGPPQERGADVKNNPSDDRNPPSQEETNPMDVPMEDTACSIKKGPSNDIVGSGDPESSKDDVCAGPNTALSAVKVDQGSTCSDTGGRGSPQLGGNNQDEDLPKSSSESGNSNETPASPSACVPEVSSNVGLSSPKARDDCGMSSSQQTDAQQGHDVEPLEVKVFDPVSEHRHWCPWVLENLGSQTTSNCTPSLPSSPPRTHPNRARYLRRPAMGDRGQAGWKRMLHLLVPRLSPEKKHVRSASRPEAVRRALSLVSSPIPRKMRRLTAKTTP